jgi:hypothetical protein
MELIIAFQFLRVADVCRWRAIKPADLHGVQRDERQLLSVGSGHGRDPRVGGLSACFGRGGQKENYRQRKKQRWGLTVGFTLYVGIPTRKARGWVPHASRTPLARNRTPNNGEATGYHFCQFPKR